MRHELTCLQCGKQWCRPEAMRDFSLELPAATARGGGGGLPRELPTIQTLLRTFFASEELEVGCEDCGHPRAKVEHRVAQLPRVLVLQLKRFEYGLAGVRKRLDAVRPMPSLSLGFCCDALTKPPPLVDPTSRAFAAPPPAAAAAAAGRRQPCCSPRSRCSRSRPRPHCARRAALFVLPTTRRGARCCTWASQAS